jgi:hypothetical protein
MNTSHCHDNLLAVPIQEECTYPSDAIDFTAMAPNGPFYLI